MYVWYLPAPPHTPDPRRQARCPGWARPCPAHCPSRPNGTACAYACHCVRAAGEKRSGERRDLRGREERGKRRPTGGGGEKGAEREGVTQREGEGERKGPRQAGGSKREYARALRAGVRVSITLARFLARLVPAISRSRVAVTFGCTAAACTQVRSWVTSPIPTPLSGRLPFVGLQLSVVCALRCECV